MSTNYDKNDVVTLSWLEQLRLRPGMYIGEIGDDFGHHDCIYVLLKEIVDNAVDEFIMGAGRQVDKEEMEVVFCCFSERDKRVHENLLPS